MAGTLTVTGLSASEPAGQRTFGPLTIVGTVVIGETLAIPLAYGDNTVAVPVGSVACLIVPPTNGAAALTIRTDLNSADAGLPVAGTGLPIVYPFQATPQVATTLIIWASQAQIAPITIAFV